MGTRIQSNRRNIALSALAALALSFGAGARAQVIVQTFTVPNGTSSPFSQNLTFAKFNTVVGTLTGITLSLNGSLLSNIDIFNANETNTAYSGVDSGIHEAVTGPGAQAAAVVMFTPVQSGVAAPGTTVLSNQAVSKISTDNVPFADFSFYSVLGAGTGTLTGAGNALSFNGNTTPGLSYGGTGTAGEVITLTYHYIPNSAIPEPGASTFLVAGMLGGISIIVRRRKKS